MGRKRQTEIDLVARLLEKAEEWESVEHAAEEIIRALDDARMSRKSYVGVMQFGAPPGTFFYLGVGPYPGEASAARALRSHPSAGMANKAAVVPVIGPEGLEDLKRTIDAQVRREHNRKLAR